MAVQMHVAYSSVVMGVGVFAGGEELCYLYFYQPCRGAVKRSVASVCLYAYIHSQSSKSPSQIMLFIFDKCVEMLGRNVAM